MPNQKKYQKQQHSRDDNQSIPGGKSGTGNLGSEPKADGGSPLRQGVKGESQGKGGRSS